MARSLAEWTRLLFGLHYIVSLCLCAAAILKTEADAALVALLFLSFSGTGCWLFSALSANASHLHVRSLQALILCSGVGLFVATFRLIKPPPDPRSRAENFKEAPLPHTRHSPGAFADRGAKRVATRGSKKAR